MFTGCLEVHLKIEASMSLKDKRMVIKSLKDKLKARFNVSVAETAEHDKWQVGVLGMAFVSESEGGARKEAQNALDFLYDTFDIEVTDHSLTIV
jgi:uncharacterized protein YlxP (DUF503 family)